MNEFKMVVESFRSDMKKITEVMNHRFDRNEKNVEIIKEQVGLLIEGQAEIKAELRNKVSYTDFSKLEKRVARLERKIA